MEEDNGEFRYTWGMGLPKADSLTNDPISPTSVELQIMDSVVALYSANLDCVWDADVLFNLSNTGDSAFQIVTACINVHEGRNYADSTEEEFRKIVNSTKSEFKELMTRIANLTGSEHPFIMSFLQSFSFQTLTIQSVLDGAIDSYDNLGVNKKKSMDDDPWMEQLRQERPWNNLFTSKAMVINANKFLDVLEYEISYCEITIGDGFHILKEKREMLKHQVTTVTHTDPMAPPLSYLENSTFPMVETVITYEIGMAVEPFTRNLQRNYFHIETMASESLPTYKEALYLANEIIESGELIGARSYLETNIQWYEMFWENNPYNAIKLMAIVKTDYELVGTKCV